MQLLWSFCISQWPTPQILKEDGGTLTQKRGKEGLEEKWRKSKKQKWSWSYLASGGCRRPAAWLSSSRGPSAWCHLGERTATPHCYVSHNYHTNNNGQLHTQTHMSQMRYHSSPPKHTHRFARVLLLGLCIDFYWLWTAWTKPSSTTSHISPLILGPVHTESRFNDSGTNRVLIALSCTWTYRIRTPIPHSIESGVQSE